MYLGILSDMKAELERKWREGDKVGALTIAIQSTKLLHDVSGTRFQVAKFAFVVDIVDRIGTLVFERIKLLTYPSFSAEQLEDVSIAQILESNVPESAQEVCRNWLVKISSIREVLPRSLIEITLVRLHYFLDKGREAPARLLRLAKTNRCFGEALNRILYLTFLVKVALEVVPREKEYLRLVLADVSLYMKQGQQRFGREDLPFDDYMLAIAPFFKTAFQALSTNCSEQDFLQVFFSLPSSPHFVLIHSLLLHLPEPFLSSVCIELALCIKKVPDKHRRHLFGLLLARVSARNLRARELSGIIYQELQAVTELSDFLEIYAPFNELINKNYAAHEKVKLNALLVERLSQLGDRLDREQSPTLGVYICQFVGRVVRSAASAEDLVCLEPIYHIVALVEAQSRTEISRAVCRDLAESSEFGSSQLLEAVLHFGTLGYDLDLLSPEEEALLGRWICKFVARAAFDNDFEAELSFLLRIRGTFGCIEQVSGKLVEKALRLAAHPALAARMHQKRVKSFVQQVITFCSITVTPISNKQRKVELLLECSTIALSKNFITQADFLLKLAITTLAEVPKDQSKTRDESVFQKAVQILNLVLVFPDDPTKEHLLLIKGTIAAFEKLQWVGQGDLHLGQLYAMVLAYLSHQAQDRLPLHLPNVTSNDELFKGKDFKQQLHQLVLQTVPKMMRCAKAASGTGRNAEDDLRLFRFFFRLYYCLEHYFAGGELASCAQRELAQAMDQVAKCKRVQPKDIEPAMKFVRRTLPRQ